MKNNKNNNCNFPNLRFPEFQEEWSETEIKNILKIGSGRDYKHLETGNIPVFGTGGYMTSINDFLYDGESVCIGRKGTINKPFYLKGKFWTVDTLFYTYSYKNIQPKFLFYIFEQINWLKYNEASGVPSLSKSTIEKILIAIPKKEEQDKIATFLSLIDERIETQNKIIEEFKLLKSTLSKRLLLNESWEQFQIADIASLGRGRVISSVEISKQRNPKYPLYSSQTSNHGIMGYLDTYDFDGEYVTWTTDGANAGTVFYRNGKFNCTNVCGTLKISSNHNPYFVALCLNLIAKKYVFVNLANPKLMNNVMASIKIHLPEIKEQNRLVKLFVSIVNKIQCEVSILEALREKKNYFLQQMFI